MRLDETVIVVTRATTGVGRAMADAFVDEGARVICTDASDSAVDEVFAERDDGPGDRIAVSADITDGGDVDALISTTVETFGSIDVFVDNAAVLPGGGTDDRRWRVDEQPEDQWDEIVETAVRGAFRCSRAVLQGMRERGQGRLLHFTSGLGRYGRVGWGPYVAATHAIEGLHKTISLESADTGVDSLLFGGPRGTTYADHPTEGPTFDPAVIATPAVALAAGSGENGEHYLAGDDGETLVAMDEGRFWPVVDVREQVGPGDTMSWSVDLHPGDEFVVEARVIEGAAPVIEVADPDGTPMVTIDDIGIGEQVRQRIGIDTEGRHAVHFRNDAPLASGQWDITLSLREQE